MRASPVSQFFLQNETKPKSLAISMADDRTRAPENSAVAVFGQNEPTATNTIYISIA
jgi:hypothetical protein